MELVHHHPSRFVFDLEVDGEHCGYLSYSLSDGVLTINYVEVDPPRRGHGLGRVLVDAAERWAREERYEVRATCPYAALVLARTENRRRR
jgi:predicted GNAT family acetyltransferase